MSYKNTVKLFASNFTLVWKQALYLIICGFLFVLFSYTTITPIINLLKEHSIFLELKSILHTVYDSPSELALKLSEILKHTTSVIFDNFSRISLSVIGAGVLCLILPFILVQMSTYNLSSIVYQKISMNMNVYYVQNGVHVLKNSLKFALANFLFSLPFAIITILLIEIYLLVANTILTAIIGLMVLIALFIVMSSIKSSIFSYYTGHMVATGEGPFKSFGKGIINILKNFWKILSTSIIINLTIILVNGFIAVFTFFSGLIITIPATFVFLSIYNQVVYCNIKGERYYLSENLIYNPVKYTIRQDNFAGAALPEEPKEIQVTTTVMKKRRYKKTKSNTKKK